MSASAAGAGGDLAAAVSEFEKASAGAAKPTVDLVEGIAPPPTGEKCECLPSQLMFITCLCYSLGGN